MRRPIDDLEYVLALSDVHTQAEQDEMRATINRLQPEEAQRLLHVAVAALTDFASVIVSGTGYDPRAELIAAWSRCWVQSN